MIIGIPSIDPYYRANFFFYKAMMSGTTIMLVAEARWSGGPVCRSCTGE